MSRLARCAEVAGALAVAYVAAVGYLMARGKDDLPIFDEHPGWGA